MADASSDPVYIIPDSPVCEKADFGFFPYITTIADLIAYRENKTPLVIGIYGKWGSGKTTLMRSIEQELKTKQAYKAAPFRRCKPVWFQAWKYKNEDQILAALLEQICNTMAKEDFFTQCRTQIEEIITKLKPGKALGELLKNLTGADVSTFFQEMPHKEKLGFYDEFEAFFKRLIWTYLSWRPQKNSFETYDDSKGILTIFIDDLDRCPKGNIVAVLETVKLFMDIPGCVFVIGADNGVIIQALEENYQENAERFMDKIVQVTFNLPRIPDEEFNPYLDKILKTAGREEDLHLKKYLAQLLPVLDNNPRNFKRFLNDLNLQKGLITNKGLKLEPKHLLLWNLIEKGFRSCYLALKEEGGYRVLEAVHNVLKQAKEKEIDFEDIGDEGNDIKIPDSVAGFVSDRRLVNILGGRSKFCVSNQKLI
jgi:iron(II)-dependent oxidoreductase